MPERATALKPTRALEEAAPLEEQADVTNRPVEKSVSLGFACPYNAANEPHAAVTGSHKTVGRVGSICLLDGRSNEPSKPRRPRGQRRPNDPPSGAW